MKPRDLLVFKFSHLGLAIVLTGLALAASSALSMADIATTLAPALPAIVAAGVVGGMVPAVASAVLVGLYSHLLFPSDLPRAIVVNSSFLLGAALIGYLQAKARLVDSLNGNLDRLRLAIQAEDDNLAHAEDILGRWDLMGDDERLRQIRLLALRIQDNRHHLAHLVTLVFGWWAIRREIDEAQAATE